MKKLLFILILLPIIINAQKINDDRTGYFKVYETELTVKEANQKIIEWIAENYKSAKDVIQLNTDKKIILKGNFLVPMMANDLSINYRVHKTLTFTFREGRYKIDLVPTRISYKGTDVDFYMFSQFITDENMSKENYSDFSIKAAKKSFTEMGYSEKKAQKMINKYLLPLTDINYKNYLDNRIDWDNSIKATFKSIGEFVNNVEDDW
tara:strand:- start:81 stop:701 length:621 start_codon:yes stop_codon:yes gene_type:complete